MDDTSLIIRRCKRSNDRKLDLRNKNIIVFPPEIFQLMQLEELDLSYNKIQNLDQRIGELKNLKILNLSNNQIRNLPQNIIQLGLERLNLENNPLTVQFQALLKKENQNCRFLQDTLKQAFGVATGNQNMSVSNTQMNEVDFMLQKEKNKVKDLEDQIQKLKMNSTNSFQINKQNMIKINNYLLQSLEIENQYLIVKEVVSQGGFSIVHRGEYKGCEVAIKQIFDPNITDELLEQVSNEIQNLSYFRHPNIVQIMGIISNPQKLSIITEYVPQTLFQVIHKNQINLKEDQKVSIIKQLARSILYIHLSGYVHRDIKSHNILLDYNYNLKLCDFGLTSKINQIQQGPNQFWGTPTYMAPELFQKKAYDHKIDIFAFGNVMYEIYEKQLPFDGFEVQDLMQKVTKGEGLSFRYCNKSIQSVINQCRQVDPGARPDMNQIIKTLNDII